MSHSILVVDDSPTIVDILVELLKENGFRPIPASSGEECLRILKDTIPDLILLDLMMEPMDGWETLGHIKKNPETANIPVIILTAKAPTPEEIKEYGPQIDDYIMKPWKVVTVEKSVNGVLERNRSLQEEIEGFRRSDLDSRLLNEYSTLVRGVEVLEKLLALLDKIYSASEKGDKFWETMTPEIEEIKGMLEAQKSRLEDLKEQFK